MAEWSLRDVQDVRPCSSVGAQPRRCLRAHRHLVCDRAAAPSVAARAQPRRPRRSDVWVGGACRFRNRRDVYISTFSISTTWRSGHQRRSAARASSATSGAGYISRSMSPPLPTSSERTHTHTHIHTDTHIDTHRRTITHTRTRTTSWRRRARRRRVVLKGQVVRLHPDNLSRYSHARARTHTCARAHTHTHTHTHTHKHAHTHFHRSARNDNVLRD